MKYLLIATLLLIVLPTAGQTSSKDNLIISNQKTAKHINIPGTKLFMIPPDDFSIATAFTGLEKGQNALIQVYDLVGGNFYSNADKFSKERFQQSGATVFDYQEMTINGFPAKYIHMQADPDKKAYSLVFGDESFSVMIMALYTQKDGRTEEQIKKSLLSATYQKDLPIDPFAAAAFELDDSNTKFKFAKSAANMFIYSVNGIDNPDTNRDSIMLVLPVPTDSSMTAKSISEQMVGSLKSNGLSDAKIISTSDDALNDYSAYQIKIEGVMNGNPSKLLVQTVTHGNNAVVFEGFLKEKSSAVIEDFEALIATLKMKQ